MKRFVSFRQWMGALIVTVLFFALVGMGEKHFNATFQGFEGSRAIPSLEEQMERTLRAIPGVNTARVTVGANQAVVDLHLSLAATRDDIYWVREEAAKRLRITRPELDGYLVRAIRSFPPDTVYRNY